MRVSVAICTFVAFIASVSEAKKCNPSYKVPKSPACFTNCNVAAGQLYVKGWTMDRTSKRFIPSLKLLCDRTGPNYSSFMTKAGICMSKCTENPELFNKEYQGACAWYSKHKKDKC